MKKRPNGSPVMCVYCEDLGENWPCNNRTALYLVRISPHSIWLEYHRINNNIKGTLRPSNYHSNGYETLTDYANTNMITSHMCIIILNRKQQALQLEKVKTTSME